jgi:hypothetical protein
VTHLSITLINLPDAARQWSNDGRNPISDNRLFCGRLWRQGCLREGDTPTTRKDRGRRGAGRETERDEVVSLPASIFGARRDDARRLRVCIPAVTGANRTPDAPNSGEGCTPPWDSARRIPPRGKTRRRFSPSSLRWLFGSSRHCF